VNCALANRWALASPLDGSALVTGRKVDRSRFWLRRDADDRARQLVYDPVQLGRYSDRQRRAILKLMARGKTASHRDIRQAARRARKRPRGELLVAIALALSVIAVLAIVVTGGYRRPNRALAADAAALAPAADVKAEEASADLTKAMEKADRAWLSDVGAGKVASANDGSDALSLPESTSPGASADEPREARPRGHRRNHQR
jgi:hypothetical protein